MTNPAPLLGGVARASLAPAVGTRLAGSLRDGVSRAVHQELSTSALYLAEGDTRVLIVACDLILMPPEQARSYREAAAKAAGVVVENVLFSLSHSHATPSPLSWGEYDYEADEALRHEVGHFFDQVLERVALVSATARRNARPVRVTSGRGLSDINVNRRERRSDGAMLLGSNPEGPADREVGVVRVDDMDGNSIAAIFNYACHPDVLGPKSDLISPDFVGPARDAMESVTGSTAIFLQGAAGDIYPCTGIVNGPDGVEVATRLGRRLGAEAARVHETLSSRRQPKRRIEWRSTASITTSWEYEDTPGQGGRNLAVAHSTIDMPLRALPSLEEAAALVATHEEALAALAVEAPLSGRLIANRRLAWSRLQLQAVVDRMPLSLPVELQAIRIGDAAIVAVPGELFTEIGLAMKRDSPFPTTLVSAYSNGVYFYIPTRAAFEQGGYEINSHQNYLRPSGPTADWEDLLVAEVHDLLTSIS